jgi:hypothetical protein
MLSEHRAPGARVRTLTPHVRRGVSGVVVITELANLPKRYEHELADFDYAVASAARDRA